MALRRIVKLSLLHAARAVGAFRLAQWLTRRKLRILCYHGFSVGDEYQYMPVMFMRPETFARRMQVLARLGIPVVGLDDAVRMLEEDSISRCETVITLDDGWATNLSVALPILRQHGFPATVYVTSDHYDADTPVFNVAVDYLCKTVRTDTVTLQGVHPALDGTYNVRSAPLDALRQIIRGAERHLDVGQRQSLLPAIARAFGSSADELLGGERFRLLDRRGLKTLADGGIAIELHTHSHRLPAENFEATAMEIRKNRSALHEVLGVEPKHFCYPSGMYADQHPAGLKSLEVKSATTCEPGLNDRNTNVYLLRRHLDREGAAEVEFEAEVSGFIWLTKSAVGMLRRGRNRQ